MKQRGTVVGTCLVRGEACLKSVCECHVCWCIVHALCVVKDLKRENCLKMKVTL